MNLLVEKSSGVNGSGAICGRGLQHRKLSDQELVGLAADVAMGLRQFEPSIGQLSTVFKIPPAKIREELNARRDELKARAAASSEEASDAISTFVDLWYAISEPDRVTAFQQIGPGAVWDTLTKVIE